MKMKKSEGGRPMKIDRLVGMVMLLLDRERVGAQELADRFEISLRTVYRDIDAIGRAGIPVRSVPGVGGGFEIMREYKVDRKFFSSADLSAILMGLSSLSGMLRGDEVVGALAKVRRFIPADRAKDIELKASQIAIDASPWMGDRDMQPLLHIIKTALQESRLLSFDYTDRFGQTTARTAEPYQLVLKGSHWYWLGFCRLRDDYRLFKLTRVSKLRVLDETFAPRAYRRPPLDFSERIAAMQTTVVIRIHRSVMDRVLDYCAFENFSPDGDEHYTVRFPFIENDYHYDILLSFGDRCECLGPLRIRAEMMRRIRAMAALYERSSVEWVQ